MDEPIGKDRLEELLRAAVWAPSSHNTQPWVFQQGPDAIRLFADRTRALPANDPHDRELTISCGCALFNLRVAAAAHGLGSAVKTWPDPNDEDLLAELDLGSGDDESGEIGGLIEQIPHRRTHRKRFEDRQVPAETLQKLSAAVAAEGSELLLIDDAADRETIVGLVADGDDVQWSDPSWRRELAQWMHPRRRGDGLTVPGLVAPIAQAVVRTFDMGNGVAAKDRELAESSPALAVLATREDTADCWLAAGQALERCLLTAAREGLQASYLNQPIQVAALRPRLQDVLAGRPYPQVLLRFGYPAEDIAAPPRRDLQAVLESERLSQE
jgi:nitroreductase